MISPHRRRRRLFLVALSRRENPIPTGEHRPDVVPEPGEDDHQKVGRGVSDEEDR